MDLELSCRLYTRSVIPHKSRKQDLQATCAVVSAPYELLLLELPKAYTIDPISRYFVRNPKPPRLGAQHHGEGPCVL